jgi:hypothetical protein
MNKKKTLVSTKWWGDVTANNATQLQLAFAGLLLNLAFKDNEWLFQYEISNHSNVKTLPLKYSELKPSNIELKHQQRFVFSLPPTGITLQPALADRPVICRPNITVILVPNEEISLFVAIPLWLQLKIDTTDIPLIDIPTLRLSDTWFGPNAREGIICYASNASEQLQITPSDTHDIKATIEIRIKNHSDENLVLDKVSIPVNNLGLYADTDDHLYTRRVILTREGSNNGSLTIDTAMSCNMDESSMKLITPPRKDLGGNKITQALWSLFG